MQQPNRLVAALIAASYTVQTGHLTQYARTDSKDITTGLSGWYITLLSASATFLLTNRFVNLYSLCAYECLFTVDLTYIQGATVVSAFLAPVAHWVGSHALLACYSKLRHRNRKVPATACGSPSCAEKTEANSSTTSQPACAAGGDHTTPAPTTARQQPSTTAILLTVITSAIACFYPSYRLVPQSSLYWGDEPVDAGVAAVIMAVMGAAGFFTASGFVVALAAGVVQVRRMRGQRKCRSQSQSQSESQTPLSIPGLALHATALVGMAILQDLRISPASVGSSMASQWVAVAVSQLMVLCCALYFGDGAGRGTGAGGRGRGGINEVLFAITCVATLAAGLFLVWSVIGGLYEIFVVLMLAIPKTREVVFRCVEEKCGGN
ncbi:hypothetical protein BDW74DRAFT_162751 [Aspergillus multicolor]|uniref:uncharacterized protein n=1 Tax=Aspergillus multicolor TaxID=41759 RepID=UPI003CCD370C